MSIQSILHPSLVIIVETTSQKMYKNAASQLPSHPNIASNYCILDTGNSNNHCICLYRSIRTSNIFSNKISHPSISGFPVTVLCRMPRNCGEAFRVRWPSPRLAMRLSQSRNVWSQRPPSAGCFTWMKTRLPHRGFQGAPGDSTNAELIQGIKWEFSTYVFDGKKMTIWGYERDFSSPNVWQCQWENDDKPLISTNYIDVGVPYFKPAWIRGQVWPSHKAPDWDGITGMTSSDGFLMVLPRQQRSNWS